MSMVIIVILITILLSYKGYSYYQTPLEERFFHPDHNNFKPSGPLGHGLGIVGSFLIVFGVSSYMARKRFKMLSRLGIIKHWLEFHIFLCVLGPIMVLFHTAFKFGGIVSVSFWSMVAVVASGVIGRFIYLQIPRTIEGRELSLIEVRGLRNNINESIQNLAAINQEQYQELQQFTQIQYNNPSENKVIRFLQGYKNDFLNIRNARSIISDFNIPKRQQKHVLKLVKNEISLNRRIGRLLLMQKVFRYWHVIHLPFAIVMLVIMIIHVAVTVAFGYKWIF